MSEWKYTGSFHMQEGSRSDSQDARICISHSSSQQWDRVRKCMKGTECGNQRTQEGLLYVDDAYCSAEPAVDF